LCALLSQAVLGGTVHTAGITFGVLTQVGSRYHVLDRDTDTHT